MAARDEYSRILVALGLRTQVEMAAYLGVRQSSISDVLRRNDSDGVPAGWKLRLLETRELNPHWIQTGEGPMYMVPSEDRITTASNDVSAKPSTLDELIAEIGRLVPGSVVSLAPLSSTAQSPTCSACK
jgi:hypothetical protein